MLVCATRRDVRYFNLIIPPEARLIPMLSFAVEIPPEGGKIGMRADLRVFSCWAFLSFFVCAAGDSASLSLPKNIFQALPILLEHG